MMHQLHRGVPTALHPRNATLRRGTFFPVATGEEIHAIGADGAQRAKRWLEGTTRVLHVWMNPEDAPKLTFNWATTGSYSFDLGGSLQGGEFHNKNFYAEVKKYASAGDQGTEYRKYLGKCYLALKQQPAMCDHFMWITWAPFSISKWPQLMTAEYVKECVIKYSVKVLGAAGATPDDAACQGVADRLWLIVLSDRQEELRLTDEERGRVIQHRIEAGTQ